MAWAHQLTRQAKNLTICDMPELLKTPSGRIWALDVNQTEDFLEETLMKYMIEY